MDTLPVDRNRLDREASPYLRAHEDNPVHWQPWDETALKAARELDRPIFLSIGYAACHWCHVMAEESFEDEDIAAILNERFVPIKVDREERPDLDGFYQTASQVTSGRGGWPLSAWLTPDGRPFQVVTYLPPTPRGGMPAFPGVLDRLADRWESDREGIEAHADRVVAAVERAQSPTASGMDVDGEGILEAGAHAVLRTVDWERGGFGTQGPKFPQVSRLELLLRAWRSTGRERDREAVEVTLDAMASGGMYDHVGGGFHRYATDPDWRIPHFEKMCYDNASLLELYAIAGATLGEGRYRRVARETANFMRRTLYRSGGGFYSSLDADTDGEEGATYCWSPTQLEGVLDDEVRRSLVAERFGITGESDLEGRHVLSVERSVDELARSFEMEPTEVDLELDRGLGELLAERQGRPQPARDEKVLAGWSGLATSGFAVASALLEETTLLGVATETVTFIEETLWEADERRLYRRYRDGDRAIPAFLDDYAAVARAAFDTYWSADDEAALRLALDVVDGLLDHCWEPSERRLRFAPPEVDAPPIDPIDGRDRSTPSPVALAVEALSVASGFDPEGESGSVIEAVRERYAPAARSSPTEHAALIVALDRWERGPPSMTVVAESMPPVWHRRLQRVDPDLIITRRPPGSDEQVARDHLGMDAVPPLWVGRTQRDGRPTLYPCRGRTCGPATNDIDAALAWLDIRPG